MSALTDYLKLESKAILNTAYRLDEKEVEKALNLLKKCSESNSKVIITGVGKSGIVARKIAATASNRAVPSIFMVAPRGNTKLLTLLSTPSFSSAVFRVTGKVAELDDVETATTRGCAARLKSASGDCPVTMPARIGKMMIPWSRVMIVTVTPNCSS